MPSAGRVHAPVEGNISVIAGEDGCSLQIGCCRNTAHDQTGFCASAGWMAKIDVNISSTNATTKALRHMVDLLKDACFVYTHSITNFIKYFMSVGKASSNRSDLMSSVVIMVDSTRPIGAVAISAEVIRREISKFPGSGMEGRTMRVFKNPSPRTRSVVPFPACVATEGMRGRFLTVQAKQVAFTKTGEACLTATAPIQASRYP